jgi:hypothetical protein
MTTPAPENQLVDLLASALETRAAHTGQVCKGDHADEAAMELFLFCMKHFHEEDRGPIAGTFGMPGYHF